MAIGFSLAFLLMIIALVYLQKLSGVIIYFYLMLSIITFSFYRMDKFSAKKRYWRISEKRLHFMSLFGGWPCALLAQQILRHKSSKRSFRIISVLTVLVNLASLVALFTKQRQLMMQFVDASLIEMVTE